MLSEEGRKKEGVTVVVRRGSREKELPQVCLFTLPCK
jgi:hypothetical protein